MNEETKEAIRLHGMWARGEDGGVCADLNGADLRCAYLSGADLSHADLGYADLGDAILVGANLRRSNLRGADLRFADLHGADLYRADMLGAFIFDAKAIGAIAWGTVDIYSWYAINTDAGCYLVFGCETHNLATWKEKNAELARRHEPKNAEKFERIISSIVAMVEAAL